MEAKCERGDVGSASTSLGARLRASPRQLGSRGPRDGGAAAQSPGDQAGSRWRAVTRVHALGTALAATGPADSLGLGLDELLGEAVHHLSQQVGVIQLELFRARLALCTELVAPGGDCLGVPDHRRKVSGLTPNPLPMMEIVALWEG